MNNLQNIKIKYHFIWIVVLVIFCSISLPNKTHAVGGVADSVIVNADTSPTGIENFLNHTMTNLKDFVLDKAATLLAKQFLHMLTLSVINWINTGFEGSPSFLTNPGAFFLDAADQVTGAFLATNGPLSALCSPFAIDIRLSLALSQTSLSTQRYTCTVGRIIEAQKNGPDIIVNGKVVRSSNSSMNGFLKGDFNQGGWPAFIALTTEPQNNPYGAFLSAEGELSARINARQNVIRADLQLGQGFMSWQSCKDIPGSTIDPEDPAQVEEANQISGYGRSPSVKTKNNKDGTQTYQTCETQTPGSAIAGTLQTSLNVPTVELELANDINAVVNALMTQMISTMMKKGLGSLSTESGGGPSYTQQAINDIDSTEALQSSIGKFKSAVNTAIEQIPKRNNQYKQGIDLMTATKTRFQAIRACLQSRSSNNIADGGITEIDNLLAYDIEGSLTKLKTKYDEGLAEIHSLEAMVAAVDRDPNEIQVQTGKFTEYIRNGGTIFAQKVEAADIALLEAKTLAQKLNAELVKYQLICPRI
jgi:hypothetical protein